MEAGTDRGKAGRQGRIKGKHGGSNGKREGREAGTDIGKAGRQGRVGGRWKELRELGEEGRELSVNMKEVRHKRGWYICRLLSKIYFLSLINI